MSANTSNLLREARWAAIKLVEFENLRENLPPNEVRICRLHLLGNALQSKPNEATRLKPIQKQPRWLNEQYTFKQ
jgi:hypothetical protein